MNIIRKSNAFFRSNAAAAVASVRRGVASIAGKTAALAAGVFGASALTAPGDAHALGAAALTSITGMEADVQAILLVLVGVVFLLVLFAYIKRAK